MRPEDPSMRDAVLLRFNSDAHGDQAFVGHPSGTHYLIGGGQSFWVFAEDASGFLQHEDFELLDDRGIDLAALSAAPALEASKRFEPPTGHEAEEAEAALEARNLYEAMIWRYSHPAPRRPEPDPRLAREQKDCAESLDATYCIVSLERPSVPA